MRFDEKQQRKNADDWRRWAGFGFEFAGAIVVLGFLGYLADRKLETGPWLMLAGSILAFVGMFYIIFKELFNTPWK